MIILLTKACIYYNRLRYRLMPYIYSLAGLANQEGLYYYACTSNGFWKR
jgi:hypothetical protein